MRCWTGTCRGHLQGALGDGVVRVLLGLHERQGRGALYPASGISLGRGLLGSGAGAPSHSPWRKRWQSPAHTVGTGRVTGASGQQQGALQASVICILSSSPCCFPAYSCRDRIFILFLAHLDIKMRTVKGNPISHIATITGRPVSLATETVKIQTVETTLCWV